MTRVSVVVPTYQRASRLPALVAGLEAQTLPRGEFEVFIVDNASTDSTAAVLAELAERTTMTLRALRIERNRGPAPARNAGWRNSSAPIVAFIDDDNVPSPGWLEAGLAAFDDERVGVVQGRTLPDPSEPLRPFHVSQRIDEFTNLYETCNIFYRRNVLEAVGGFDESFGFFGEDTVPGWSARRLGVVVRFAADALAHHAVTYPGVRWHLRWAMHHGKWAGMIRRFPEMRREMLFLRVFTKRRHAALLGALAGIAAGTQWWPAYALAVPYLWKSRPDSLHPRDVAGKILGAGFDLTVLTSLVIGSLRERTLVL